MKSKSVLSISNVIIGLCMLIVGIVGTFFTMKSLETSNQFYYINKPKLVLIDTPKVTGELIIKTPKFPSVLRIINEIQINKDTLDNKLFLKKSTVIDTNIDISEIKSNLQNIDSISKSKCNDSDLAILKLDIKLNLQNKGNVCANNICYVYCDTTSASNVLRKRIEDNTLFKNGTFNLLKDFEIYSQDVGSTQEISISGITPIFINENGDCIVHIMILYQGFDNRYYDTYVKILINIKNLNTKILFEPLYIKEKKNLFKLDKIVFHYFPFKPIVQNLIKLKKYDSDNDYVYSKSSSEIIENTFLK
ncbi:MAG: hypothetical protein AB2L26_10390 [Ignavibacteria bacterium]